MAHCETMQHRIRSRLEQQQDEKESHQPGEDSAGQKTWLPFTELLRFGYLEAVARAAHRSEITRVLRVDFDLLTDAANVDIDGTGSNESGIAPDGIEQV